MLESLKQLVDLVDLVTKSDFALAIILLLVVALCIITINNMVSRVKHDLRLALLECREDSLKDMKFNTSLIGLVSKYQLIVFRSTGGNRSVPPELSELKQEFMELRHSMHTETNRRVARVESARKLLEEDRKYRGRGNPL